MTVIHQPSQLRNNLSLIYLFLFTELAQVLLLLDVTLLELVTSLA